MEKAYRAKMSKAVNFLHLIKHQILTFLKVRFLSGKLSTVIYIKPSRIKGTVCVL